MLLELARLFNNDTGETGPAEVQSREDQAILDAFRAEISDFNESSCPTAG